MLLSSCSPPKESIAGVAYKQCMDLIKFMEKAGGKKEVIYEQKNKCKCVANATWKIEKTGGCMDLEEKVQRAAKRQCMTETEKKEINTRRLNIIERKRALKSFVSTIDSLFK